MSAPITQKIFCIYNRKKYLRAHLKEQEGTLLTKFEEVPTATQQHGEFIVTVKNQQQLWDLAISIGRFYILQKLNISADDKKGGY